MPRRHPCGAISENPQTVQAERSRRLGISHGLQLVARGDWQRWPLGLADLGLPAGQGSYCFRRPTLIVWGGVGSTGE